MSRKGKDITPELKLEIIQYAKENSPWKAQKKYGVWSDTIKYWIDPGYRSKAKETIKKYHHHKMETDTEYRENRRRIAREYRKTGEYYQYMTNYQKDNFDKIQKRTKQHRTDNLEHYKDKSKENFIKHRERYRESAKKWYQKNKEKCNARGRERYRTETNYKLMCEIRSGIGRALRCRSIKKNHPSIKYLGCTVEEFKVYIESKFTDNMTWDNHGRGEEYWHLDHIKPLSSIDLGDVEQLKQACHYTNYQPLWEKDNLSKGSKYEE